jgi:hypothetical protein
MALSSQLDNLRLGSPALPYSKQAAELEPRPHIVEGSNMLSTVGGKLIKRPGMVELTGGTLPGVRCDRLIIYKTIESSPKVYVVGSFQAGVTYTVYYYRADGSATWTEIPALRDVRVSTRPHEFVVSRGLLFIKGFPAAASSEKQGTVIFDGRDGTTTVWGLTAPTSSAQISGANTTLASAVTAAATAWTVASDLGIATPFDISIGEEDCTVTAKGGGGNVNWTVTRAINSTTASAHSQGAELLNKNWTDSSHALTVDWGWRYAYAYKSKLKHVSCRSPIESNPDKRPSDTSGFSTKRPKVDVQGHADTTNIPEIVVFRTTDGGSELFKLETITNTGAGTIAYTDDQLAGLNGALDPQPDELLDANYPSPSLVSNLPPPTVNPPLVQGTDTPSRSSNLEVFEGRLWCGIGHILWYSGNEEIIEGVPEESWPSGNKYLLRSEIVALKATREALWVITDSDLYVLTGHDLDTFALELVAPGYGAYSSRGVTASGDKIAWVTQNLEIAMVELDQKPEVISGPLKTDILTLAAFGVDIELSWLSKHDKDLLFVDVISNSVLANSRQYVYDLDLGIWNVPWTIPASAACVGRYRETTDFSSHLLMWVSDRLCRWADDELTVRDISSDYSCYATFGLTENPAGNHLNERSVPSHTTVAHAILIERTKFSSDTDPTITYFKDDAFTTPVAPATAIDPPRRAASVGYETKLYPVSQACQRIAVRVAKSAVNERFELQTVDYIFQPGAGA